jgi:hypothetical protein
MRQSVLFTFVSTLFVLLLVACSATPPATDNSATSSTQESAVATEAPVAEPTDATTTEEGVANLCR